MPSSDRPRSPAFLLEAFVDFPDDALKAKQPITPEHIDAMMVALRARGVRRVSWGYYGDGHGGWLIPPLPLDELLGQHGHWQNYAVAYQQLGNPLKVAAKAAHRHGLELYAYFKPYETGPVMVFPEGSLEATMWGRTSVVGGRMTWLDRFVVDHPELRIKRRTDALSVVSTKPICALKLVKSDDAPTRITKDRLQIWVSDLNFGYRRLEADFQLTQTVERSRKTVRDLDDCISVYKTLRVSDAQAEAVRGGRAVTRAGDPVRVLTLSGFKIIQPYVVVTTDFTDGPPDFENTGVDMLAALDTDGDEIAGVFSTGGMAWNPDRVDFRDKGLGFDDGFCRSRLRLDEPNPKGGWYGRGMIGFARGRNSCLPGALCETEPAVQDYWLSCVQECLDAGVDGVDFREESHSTYTDFPDEYGFNAAVLAECARRGTNNIATVRGDAYTDFLRRAKALIGAAGRKMRINLQIEWYRRDPPGSRWLAYPANIEFQWRRWIDERLMDAAVLRFFYYPFDCLYEDEVALEIIERCRAEGLPMTVNRYVKQAKLLLKDEYLRIRDDGRFAGFILYETNDFLDCNPDNSVSVTRKEIDTLTGA